ncbi:MAG: redox-regulated ATPase YchF [Parcubacteria group bacterium]
MSFSIGIVGLPNVGKSTLFKALTKKQVNIANYPFCTIEPNKGIVEVPDDRLSKLAEMSKSEKIVPTVIEFVDIAGLVKGAHKGEGLGNKFLSHIREVDAICQVVRDFHKGEIIHVDGKVDPQNDIEVINMELAFADIETIGKHLQKLKTNLKGLKGNEEKESLKMIALLETKVMPALEAGKLLRQVDLTDAEKDLIKYLTPLTLKPMIYVLNIDESMAKDKFDLPNLKGEVVIPICAETEATLVELGQEEMQEYLKTVGFEMTGLDKLIIESYKILNLISFLTTGPDETRAWTIVKGTKAPQAAGKIHGDFERGFIAADVVNWQDLLAAGSEANAKAKGLIRLEGKEYVMKDGDVVEFKFNV